jgi:hypothetical protein
MLAAACKKGAGRKARGDETATSKPKKRGCSLIKSLIRV